LRKILIYTACVLLFSCKKEISVNIEDRPASLVVKADLFCDSLIEIDLSLTQNIVDNNAEKKVNDAVIEVFSKDSTILDVLNPQGFGRYQSSVVRPKAGNEYLFRIYHQNKVYWVDEIMPDTFDANIIDTSRVVFQGKSSFFQYRLDIKNDFFKDNFFSFRIKRISQKVKGLDTVLVEEWCDIETVDFILTESPQTRFSKKQLLFTDLYFRGLRQEFKLGTSIANVANQKTLRLVLFVTSHSKSGYNYYTSVNEHLFYQNDPFSQPTILKGNVPNAYGAAVGQITKRYEINFK
jgi:hypothetical protein